MYIIVSVDGVKGCARGFRNGQGAISPLRHPWSPLVVTHLAMSLVRQRGTFCDVLCPCASQIGSGNRERRPRSLPTLPSFLKNDRDIDLSDVAGGNVPGKCPSTIGGRLGYRRCGRRRSAAVRRPRSWRSGAVKEQRLFHRACPCRSENVVFWTLARRRYIIPRGRPVPKFQCRSCGTRPYPAHRRQCRNFSHIRWHRSSSLSPSRRC